MLCVTISTDLHRQLALRPQIDQVGAQRFRGQHVERAERFVHQQQVGMHHQRARQADALAHAAGQLLRIGAFETAQADQVDRLLGAFSALVARHAARLQTQLHILLHGQPGKQRETLEHHRHAFGGSHHRLIAPQHLAGGRRQQAGDDAQQGRLAGARAAEQCRRSRLRAG